MVTMVDFVNPFRQWIHGGLLPHPPVYSVKKFETQTFQVLICADEVVVTTKMLPEWTTVYSLFLATIGRGKQNQPSLELAVSFIPTYNIYAISQAENL